MNLIIRPATLVDAPMIHHFIEELEESTFNFEVFQDIFLHNLQNADCHYLLAFDGAVCVGYASMHIQWLLHHCGKVGEIQELFVVANYRNKGVGKLLMHALAQIATEEKLQLLEVTANKKRLNTPIFYERQGFENTHFKFVKDCSAGLT